MGTTLTGTTPQDTYDSLIKVTDNGPLSGTAKYLSDGLGNDSVLALSTAGVGVGLNTPTVKLESSGAVKAASGAFGSEGGYLLNFGGNAASRSYRLINDQSAFGDFVIQQSTTQTGSTYADRLYIGATGNVGIGTSTFDFWGFGNFGGTPITQKLATANTTDSVGVAVGSSTSSINFATLNATSSLTNINRIVSTTTDTTNNSEAGHLAFFVKSGATSTATEERFRVTANGVTFNGDTAAANALDDYEEGTFTPTTAGDATGAFSGVLGEYTKIGNVVHFRIAATISTNFTSFDIGGLPFTIGGGGSPSGVVGLISVANTGSATLVGFTSSGSTAIRLCSDNNITNTTAPTTTMGTLRMFGTYRV
jgi:hypothetical protein